MSCYGQEKGKIKMPTKEWTWFKRSLYNSYNYKLNQCYEIALKIYDLVNEEKKGKRNFNVAGNVVKYIGTHMPFKGYYSSNYHWRDLVRYSLLKDGKLKKPQKKFFKKKLASKCEKLDDDCLSIELNNKSKSIEYYTDDNNHSIDYAQNSYLGEIFFNLLNRVNFTNKTGGYFQAKTEYDEWGGPRVSRTYGKYDKPKYFRGI